jgi:hypothetical protein
MKVLSFNSKLAPDSGSKGQREDARGSTILRLTMKRREVELPDPQGDFRSESYVAIDLGHANY